MERNEVQVAFDILMEEIEIVASSLNQDGADAFRSGSYDKARELIEMATRLSDFREKVKALEKDWSNLFAPRIIRPKPSTGHRRLTRLQRGLRTPEDAFRHPILEALVELGGAAPSNQVLDLVGVKMKGRLNEYDHQPIHSDPREPRWRNSTEWCRNTLVQEGLMKSDSPRGTWGISDTGREALRSNRV